MEQTCLKCGELKPLDKFPKTKSKTTGKEYRRHQCKACGEAARTLWRRANVAHVNAVRKRWRETSPVYKANRNIKHKSWRDRNRKHVRQYRRANEIKRLYGMTSADVASMSATQGGVCASCGGPPDDQRPLMVDHDHATGAVRGLLCNSCNLTLGRSKESLHRLRSLILYLERPQLRLA